MCGGSGGGGNGGRSGGGGSMDSPTMQNDISAGLLKGVQPGSRNEIKIKEMAASGLLSQNKDTGQWRYGPFEGKTAKSVASHSDYKPIGERIKSLEGDLLNLNTKFPHFKFDKVESKIAELKSEKKRLYG